MLNTAIILAGGFGTRLQSVVKDLPKPMAPINGKPFLEFVLKYCAHHQLKKVVLSVGYKHESIHNYFGNKFQDIEISYCVDENPLGTGGAIKAAIKNVSEEHVLILNGDTFFNVNVAEFYTRHAKSNAICSIALKQMKNFDRYGIVSVDSENLISGFEEKAFRASGNINGGVYILNKNIEQHFPSEEKFSFEKDFMEKKFSDLKMKGFLFDDYFIDIGIPEDYNRAQHELAGFTY